MKDIMEIKDKYKGRSAFIAGCGVSLNDYSEEQIKEEIKDDVVLCIKQSQLKFKDECDFHFINRNNLIQYSHNPKTQIIASHSHLSKVCTNPISYIITEVYNGPGTENQSVAYNKDFSVNEIKTNNQQNLLGPGIMYGLVIPFVVHCGFSHIKFLGWDYKVSKDENVLSHFYNNKERENFENPANPLFGGKSPSGEYQMVIKSTDELYRYLSSKGITSEILTDKSLMSDLFPRRILG